MPIRDANEADLPQILEIASDAGHRQLLACCQARDADAAARLLTRHIEDAAGAVAALLAAPAETAKCA